MSQEEGSTEAPFFGDVIYAYTRAQAIADGVLIDISAIASEAGFRWPVALTNAAWQDCVAWSEADNATQTYQDGSGRLSDVVFMAVHAVKTQRSGGRELRFELMRIPRDGRATVAAVTTLKLLVGPGDHGEPVATILLPDED